MRAHVCISAAVAVKVNNKITEGRNYLCHEEDVHVGHFSLTLSHDKLNSFNIWKLHSFLKRIIGDVSLLKNVMIFFFILAFAVALPCLLPGGCSWWSLSTPVQTRKAIKSWLIYWRHWTHKGIYCLSYNLCIFFYNCLSRWGSKRKLHTFIHMRKYP